MLRENSRFMLRFIERVYLKRHGTSGRTRTATSRRTRDFESLMSTNFITLAQMAGLYANH